MKGKIKEKKCNGCGEIIYNVSSPTKWCLKCRLIKEEEARALDSERMKIFRKSISKEEMKIIKEKAKEKAINKVQIEINNGEWK